MRLVIGKVFTFLEKSRKKKIGVALKSLILKFVMWNWWSLSITLSPSVEHVSGWKFANFRCVSKMVCYLIVEYKRLFRSHFPSLLCRMHYFTVGIMRIMSSIVIYLSTWWQWFFCWNGTTQVLVFFDHQLHIKVSFLMRLSIISKELSTESSYIRNWWVFGV